MVWNSTRFTWKLVSIYKLGNAQTDARHRINSLAFWELKDYRFGPIMRLGAVPKGCIPPDISNSCPLQPPEHVLSIVYDETRECLNSISRLIAIL